MADKPIISLPVDSEDFDALLKKIAAYKQDLSEFPEAWARQAEGVKTLETGFEKAADSFSKIKTLGNDSKLTGQSSFMARFEKSSANAEKSWGKMSRWISDSNKNLTGIARMAIISGSRGGLFGAASGGVLGLAGAIVGGTAAAASSLAGQNAQMRALGLKPGEEAAFTTEYEKFGGDETTLEKAAEAKRNKQYAAGLGFLGFSSKEIADVPNMNVADIAKLMLQHGGEKYKQEGPAAGIWASLPGVKQFFNADQLQQAGSYDSKAYADANKEFEELIPKLALQQRAYDEGTEALRKFNEALKEDEMTLLTAFEPLLGPVSTLAKEFSDAVAAFAKSGELEADINATITAFEDVASVVSGVKDKLNELFGLSDKNGNTGTPMYSAPAGSVGANVVQFGQNVWDFLHGRKLDDSPTSKAVNWNPFHSDSNGGGGSSDNNVGNLKNVGGNGFQTFASKEAGAKAMALQLMLYEDRDHLDTVQDIVTKWAPASDHNNTKAYIDDVSKKLSVKPGERLDLHDQKVLDALEAAMATHEKGVTYSPADIDAMLSSKPQPGNNPKDMTPAARKEYREVQRGYTSPVATDMQGPNSVGLGMTDHILNEISNAVQHMDRTVTGLFREGGLASLRTPDAPRSSNKTLPYNPVKPTVNVIFTNQTGSDINTTLGSTAH